MTALKEMIELRIKESKAEMEKHRLRIDALTVLLEEEKLKPVPLACNKPQLEARLVKERVLTAAYDLIKDSGPQRTVDIVYYITGTTKYSTNHYNRVNNYLVGSSLLERRDGMWHRRGRV